MKRERGIRGRKEKNKVSAGKEYKEKSSPAI